MERGTIFFRSTKYNPWDRGTPTISNGGRKKKLRKTNHLVHKFCFMFIHSITITYNIAVNRIIPPLGNTPGVRAGRVGGLLARKKSRGASCSLPSHAPNAWAGDHAVSEIVKLCLWHCFSILSNFAGEWLSRANKMDPLITPAARPLPWQAPVRTFGMKPRRQGWGWAGHISQGWPQARPTVAQQSVFVQTIPLSCPWHIWLLITVKHGPVL